MAITTKIHSIDETGGTAVITIVDGIYFVKNAKNIKVKFDEDGNIDSEWLVRYTQYSVLHDRLVRLGKAEDDLL